MSNTDGFSLQWALNPLPVASFLDDIWGTRQYHISRARPDYFDSLLEGSSAVEHLLELYRPASGPDWAVRVIRPDKKSEPGAYKCADGTLDVDRVRTDFGDGCTIVFDAVEQFVRPVAALTHSIEVDVNFATKVNGYATPPHSQGFAAHYDQHDVLVLQIEGSKIWHVYPEADVSPSAMHRRQPVLAEQLPEPTDLLVEAGDVLYLPRGRVHMAETTSQSSVHLTLGIHAPTVISLLTQTLYALSSSDDRFHHRLPPRHLSDSALRGQVSRLVGDALGAIEEPEGIAQGLGALEEVLVKRGRCPPLGQSVADAVAVHASTRVVRYQPLYARVVAAGSGVALQFATLSVNATADHRTALDFLSRRTEPFRVGELPGLSEPQQLALAQTLLLSGFLILLHGD